MGGKYSVIARNIGDYVWVYSLSTNIFIKFILASIKCLIKYDVVQLGKHWK